MSSSSQFDPQLGYIPLIPEPFWLWRPTKYWIFNWKWLPYCHRCEITFKTRQEWDTHYVLKHLQEDEAQERYEQNRSF